MFSLNEEKLITLEQAARLLPHRRLGRPVHVSSLWRWCRYGVQRNGQSIYLESAQLPSGIVTTKEALFRFIEKISGGNYSVETNPKPIQTSKITKQKLDGLGL